MPQLHKYTAAQITVEGRRHYDTPSGRFPSVTAVLRATKDMSGLMAWRRKVGAEHADAVTAAANTRGTELHASLEALLERGETPAEPSPFFASMLPFVERINEVALVEGCVWHPQGFAGAVDCVAVVDGELSIVDWKTSSKPKRREWIEDYRLQVAAYCAAVNRVYDLHIRRGLIVIALESEEAQVFERRGGEIMEDWQAFQRRLATYSKAHGATCP